MLSIAPVSLRKPAVIVCSLFCFLFGSIVLVFAWQGVPGATSQNTVLDLEQQWFQAVRTGDGLTLDRLMTADFEGTTTVGRRLDKAGWLSLFASQVKDASGNVAYRNWRIVLRDVKARAYPGVVLVRGVADMQTQHYTEVYLHVWIESPKGWLLAMAQVTPAITSPMK
jgi:hypothetical protein